MNRSGSALEAFGSTHSSFVCAAKGYRAHLVTSDAFALEKRRMMTAYGAEVEEV